MSNTMTSTYIAQVTDRPYPYVSQKIVRKNNNGTIEVLNVTHEETGSPGRPRKVYHMSREHGLLMILFLDGREKRDEVQRELENEDQQYSAEGASVYINGQRVGQCSEIKLPTTQGEDEMTGAGVSSQVAVQQQDDGEMKMSSREIAELTGKLHKNVMADIRTMCEQMEINSAEFSAQYKDTTGRSLPCFELDRYHTEILITGYDVKRRAAVIKRWFDLESGAATPHHQQVQQFQIPQTMSEALKLAGEQWEAREKAEQQALEYKGQSEQYQKQIETNAPKVEFAEQVSSTRGTMMVREAAKLLDLSQQRLYAKLREWGWVMSGVGDKKKGRNEPFQSRVDSGHLSFRITSQYRDPETGKLHIKKTTLVTGKGLALIQKKLTRGE